MSLSMQIWHLNVCWRLNNGKVGESRRGFVFYCEAMRHESPDLSVGWMSNWKLRSTYSMLDPQVGMKICLILRRKIK